MSNRTKHRRQGRADRRTEHGPSWESNNPGAGCNSTQVARARAGWKRIAARSERHTGSTSTKCAIFLLMRRTRPDPDQIE